MICLWRRTGSTLANPVHVYTQGWLQPYIYDVHTVFLVFLAGKLLNIQAYTIYGINIYGSGQPYIYDVHTVLLVGRSPYMRSFTVCIYSSGQP